MNASEKKPLGLVANVGEERNLRDNLWSLQVTKCIEVLFCTSEYRSMRKKCPHSELLGSTFLPRFPAFGLNTDSNS